MKTLEEEIKTVLQAPSESMQAYRNKLIDLANEESRLHAPIKTKLQDALKASSDSKEAIQRAEEELNLANIREREAAQKASDAAKFLETDPKTNNFATDAAHHAINENSEALRVKGDALREKDKAMTEFLKLEAKYQIVKKELELAKCKYQTEHGAELHQLKEDATTQLMTKGLQSVKDFEMARIATDIMEERLDRIPLQQFRESEVISAAAAKKNLEILQVVLPKVLETLPQALEIATKKAKTAQEILDNCFTTKKLHDASLDAKAALFKVVHQLESITAQLKLSCNLEKESVVGKVVADMLQTTIDSVESALDTTEATTSADALYGAIS